MNKIEIKCADCGCTPKECKQSPSLLECPNCTLEICCCWNDVHNA